MFGFDFFWACPFVASCNGRFLEEEYAESTFCKLIKLAEERRPDGGFDFLVGCKFSFSSSVLIINEIIVYK